jgi:hypothetical protein
MRKQCKQTLLQAAQTYLFATPIAREWSKLDMAVVFSALAALADDSDREFAEAAWGFSLLEMLHESDGMGITQGIFDSIRQKAEIVNGYERYFLAPYLLAKTKYDAFLSAPDVRKDLLSGGKSPEELFVKRHIDFLEELSPFKGDVVIPQLNAYSAEAAKDCLSMIPDTAVEDNAYKSLFLGNIERVLRSIYHEDHDGHVRETLHYWQCFARFLLRLGAEDRANALTQVAKVPSALSNSDFFTVIVHAANDAKARTAFWEIWATLRPAIGRLLKDRNPYMRRTNIEEAIGAYFLGRGIWFGHPEACQLVGKGDLQFFKQCLEEWEMPLIAVVAFQSFLASAGMSFWEDGIPMLGNALGLFQAAESDRLKTTLVDICGQYMKQMVMEHGDVIRKRTNLRQAALSIVQFLKTEKSQVGYDLENYVM